MMTLGFAFLLAGITLANWMHFQRVLCPAVIFSGVWAAILFGLVLSGSAFYSLSPATLALCTVSITCFSIGSRLVPSPRRTPNPAEKSYTLPVVDACLVALVSLFPLYWERLNTIGMSSGDPNFLRKIRADLVLNDVGEGGMGLGPFRYIIPLLVVFTLIATVECYRARKGKWRIAVWMLLSLAYFLPTGSRLGAMILLISVVCAISLSSGRLRLHTALLFVLLFTMVFSFAAVELEKGGSPYSTLEENVSGVTYSFRLYALGGIVACDQLLSSNTEPTSGQINSLRFFYAFSRTIGLPVTVPANVEISVQTPELTNVYSIYYYYFEDFGWLGLMAIFICLGSLLGFVFNRALRGFPEAIVLSSVACAYLVFTCSGDPFLNGLSPCIQTTAEVFAVYFVARLLRRAARRRTARVRSHQQRFLFVPIMRKT